MRNKAEFAVVIGIAAMTMLVPTLPLGASDRVVMPAMPEARSRVSETQACVEPLEVMRRDHMRFLLHQRDRTVHEGIRTKRHSLVECIDCHASTKPNGVPVPIDAPGQFCQSCHVYAGIKMDCFECHTATPASAATAKAGSASISTPPRAQ